MLDYVDGDVGCVLQPGQVIPLESGYCQKVMRGELPQYIPDTSCVPAARDIPETAAIPIGSHLSTPIVLEDGRLFGTLCCFSRSIRAEADIGRLRYSADLLASRLPAAS
ncbi:GAF domain-containing protein [Rhizobium sp. 18055]|uniref:GAF domain-containing protein n=1 Tax=Rhizobium sp. 18055 TaxID=2681403 RepID=UPI00190F9D76